MSSIAQRARHIAKSKPVSFASQLLPPAEGKPVVFASQSCFGNQTLLCHKDSSQFVFPPSLNSYTAMEIYDSPSVQVHVLESTPSELTPIPYRDIAHRHVQVSIVIIHFDYDSYTAARRCDCTRF